MKTSLKQRLPALVMVGPIVIWLALFIVIPLIYVFAISFMNRGLYSGVVMAFTLDNYIQLLDLEYLNIFWKSILLAVETSVICLLLGYPFAMIMARADKRMKPAMMLLIMLPFWTNSLIRTYGWNTLLRSEGIINNLLLRLGLIQKPLELLYTDGAVLLGMVYTLFPFMVLPLYSSIEKLDPSLMEAAGDLGARRVRSFLRVMLPLTAPGIFAGTIQVFIPTLGYFFISDMMGGGKTMYIGNLIKNQFLSARNWPLGAALSILLILLTLLLMKLYSRVGKMEDMV
ncbi:ABC transporter permease [Angelakisella massiliensis]|uniref:ABC transporter permease n=1 Tax=Angelakisella massiliensis TaxID=1871018 RepID=UPI0024B2570E|nr:ABC transporter permease [Angelakisella massiliensis]